MAAVNVSAVVIKKPKMLFPRISTVNVAKGGEQILFTLENGTSDTVEITVESVDPEIIEVYYGIFTGNKNKECGAMAYALKHGTTKFNVKYTNADRDSIFYGEKLATKTFTVTSHSHKTEISAATYFAAGKKTVKCKSCGKTIETTTVAKKVLAVPTAKLTAAKKALKVKVNKVTGQTGFQIRYRLKGKSKWTTKTYTGKATAMKTLKLKAKKNYQVQVRAMVKSGSKKAYSNWSKTYTKKTK